VYVPQHFAPESTAWMHEFITRTRVGTLITGGEDGLNASMLPMLFDAPKMTLQAHFARANPQWKACLSARDALVIFQGVDAYISPTFYPSKAEHQRVVPTWNYEVVHVHGRLRIIDDVQWLRTLVEALTTREEARSEMPWSVSDAPEDYLATMLTQIVGVEMAIERIEGKRKIGQNRTEADRWGTIEGLKDREPDRSNHALADVMAAREP
jgi:transcriptional regulator